ncbi:MAG: chromosomal replication initiator protein DnaA, partial [Zoogloeaceae bacterium]|nr:chromosomal replication initiator protein DnaA [Zoogloeaceae bacterium]
MLSSSNELTLDDFWSHCLTRFQEELPAQQFNSWIRSLRVELAGPGQLRLLAPNRFVLQWVRERYLSRIENLLKERHPKAAGITLLLDEVPKPLEVREPAAACGAPVVSGSAIPAQGSDRSDPAYEKTRLNQSFTFETLVT